jgi:hypothetical protein
MDKLVETRKKSPSEIKVPGARNAEPEIVCVIQRGWECHATQQFARAGTYSVFPLESVLYPFYCVNIDF